MDARGRDGGSEAGRLEGRQEEFDGGRQAWEFVIKINYSDRQNGDIRRADGGGRFGEMNRKLEPVHGSNPAESASLRSSSFDGGGGGGGCCALTLCSYLLTTPDLYTIVRRANFFHFIPFSSWQASSDSYFSVVFNRACADSRFLSASSLGSGAFRASGS